MKGTPSTWVLLSRNSQYKYELLLQLYQSSLVLYTVYCANTSKYAVDATAVRGIVYTTRYCWIHIWPSNTSLHAFQLNEEQTKMLWKIIMTAAKISHLCSMFDATVWSRDCCCSKWQDNGHGDRRLLVSFVNGFCTGYHCLRETVAWLAQKIGDGWYKAQHGLNSKSGQMMWIFLY